MHVRIRSLAHPHHKVKLSRRAPLNLRVPAFLHPLFHLAVQRQERVVSLASSLEPGGFPVEESGHAEITGYCAAPSYAWKRVTITTTAGQDMERFFGK